MIKIAIIEIKNLNFSYIGGLSPIFENVNLDLDTSWRLGLIGRNGRGKTTFLNLLRGKLKGEGSISSSESFEYFPPDIKNENENCMKLLKNLIAPFCKMEQDMERLAGEGTAAAMERYGNIQSIYENADGYVIEEKIIAEAGRLNVHQSVFERDFSSLSGGEKVKLMLAAMFLKKHSFLLIDEPTDHLDMEGRSIVSKWLSEKSGFILVSHDRAFIDGAVDHILSINRCGIELQKGNYTSWRHNRSLQDEYEKAQNKKLEKSIEALNKAAERTEKWSDKVEKTKIGKGADKSNGMIDRGHIGAKAAKMMQSSKSIVRRMEREANEKGALLKNIEETEPIKFIILPTEKNRLVSGESLGLSFGERRLFSGLDFYVDKGERVAVRGANGSGKTCLLKIITGEIEKSQGELGIFSGVKISSLNQDTSFLKGSLRELAAGIAIDESLFMAILRKLDFKREVFFQPMEKFSSGQKKKVCLAASLATPANLFVWDEPLNYIDVLSREQIEAAILEFRPTMVFVEHDAAFVKNIATKEIFL